MTINLQEIRKAVQDYLDHKVNTSISKLTPDVAGTINPDEEFTFSITATNPKTENGGIRLINVRYHLHSTDPAKVKLKVPPVATATARSGYSSSDAVLAPDTLVADMYLFPTEDTLDVDDIDTISGLKGKALALGNPNISFRIYADVDMDYLFPKNQNSGGSTRTVPIQ